MPLRIAIVALMFAFACEAEAQPSWRPFVTTINGRSPIGAAFLNERYGFVTTSNNSVYRTTDAGATWIRIPNPPMTIIGMGPCYFNTPANIFLGEIGRAHV